MTYPSNECRPRLTAVEATVSSSLAHIRDGIQLWRQNGHIEKVYVLFFSAPARSLAAHQAALRNQTPLTPPFATLTVSTDLSSSAEESVRQVITNFFTAYAQQPNRTEGSGDVVIFTVVSPLEPRN